MHGINYTPQVAKVSAEHTSGDEGIEWIKNEPYDNTDGHLGVSAVTGTKVPRNKGQYTLKRYLLRSKVPSIVTHLVPTNALFLVEEAWNAYPHCKTVLVNGYLDKTRFRIVRRGGVPQCHTLFCDTRPPTARNGRNGPGSMGLGGREGSVESQLTAAVALRSCCHFWDAGRYSVLTTE